MGVTKRLSSSWYHFYLGRIFEVKAIEPYFVLQRNSVFEKKP